MTYTSEILGRSNAINSKPVNTLMNLRENVCEDEDLRFDIPYRKVIGSLIYLSVGPRPDISYAVAKVAKYVEKPFNTNWKAEKRLLRYFNGTCYYGLVFGSSKKFEFYDFVDSD